MHIVLWCLFAGVVLPYVWAFVSIPFRSRQLGTVDLAQPRLQAQQLTEGGAGAWGAQCNAWEALAVFMAATLAAYMQGLDPGGSWATASLIWVAARFSHGVFYILNVPVLRVLSFGLGLGMSLWIFVMALLV
ncbi:MAG: MAPEG family protein [bacterium]